MRPPSDAPVAMDYKLYATNGRLIRTATKVVWPDGYEVKFMERMPKRSAIAQAREVRAREAAVAEKRHK